MILKSYNNTVQVLFVLLSFVESVRKLILFQNSFGTAKTIAY